MKYYKLIGTISLLIFSFYLTDNITEFAIYNNKLMKNIIYNSSKYNTLSVNAYIDKNTIIPGIRGKTVNSKESYLNMKGFGAFNENYLIYDYNKPDISLEDNLDKVIISGNQSVRKVSLLINDNIEIIQYLKNSKICFSKLVQFNNKTNYVENINIESEKKKYLDLDYLLSKKKLNTKICIIDFSNIEVCKEKKYYLVKPSIVISNSTITSSLKEIKNGSIILIDDELNTNNFKLVLNNINTKDLKIVYLSDLIKE